MKEIHISVREGVALQTDHTPYITGDGEYRVVFDLEKEWEAHPLRTARFQTEGAYVDVVFRGNQCRVPVFTYARTLEVGIFAGNLRTTTPARIFLREGIRSAWGSPEAPAPNVYDQLMEALEDNGIVIRGMRSSEKASFRRFPEIYSQYCFFSLIIIKITIDSENKFEIRRFLLPQSLRVPAILAHPVPAVNHFLSSFSEDSQSIWA